jgi:hypothetical protein
MVSGLATHATWARAFRPSRLPISAKVDFSGSDKRNRAGKCARKTRFSANQILVLQEQFLVYKAGHVRQQAYLLGFFHLEWP